MTFKLNLEEGKLLVKLARQAVTEYLESGRIIPIPENISSNLKELCGVFVTLKKLCDGTKMLRGCIGVPYPTTPIAKAVIDVGISAATQDPRFPKVRLEELDKIIFEASVLTPPEIIDAKRPTDYLSEIEIGRDGLIIENIFNKGLLLPQVPVEFNWSTEDFLCQVAIKAGLSPDAWLLKHTKIYKFQAIIFEEETPKGNITLREI
jgi:uncharacterized protein (TIGR00296 family)